MSKHPQCNDDAVFESAVNLLVNWGLEINFALWVLGESRCSKNEVNRRALIVIDIGSSLSVLFENPKNIRRFMSMPNNNPYFMGRTPLQVIGDGELASLRGCAERLKALSMGF